MLLHQSIAEFTHCLLKKKKNNADSYPKIYVYKEFVIPNLPMQVDSFSSERKMASFAQFKTTET